MGRLVPVFYDTIPSYFIMVALVLVTEWPAQSYDLTQNWRINVRSYLWIPPNGQTFQRIYWLDFAYGPIIIFRLCEIA